ncbi:MAG TPA: TraY domain-containing protein [Candidatus Dormibacteraeota bacterium]|nr:TraY domain-containing protein [Candidatus Dormibacteraeota bacterium]
MRSRTRRDGGGRSSYPPELKVPLEEIAHRHERSLSAEVRAALREHVARYQWEVRR